MCRRGERILKRHPLCRWLVVSLLGVHVAVSGFAQEAESPFPAPSGPHPVGVLERHWVDASRLNVFTSATDDLRRVPVRIWYPAQQTDELSPAPYLFDAAEFEGVAALEGVAARLTHTFRDAPLVIGAERLPTIVYQHGGGWPRFVGSGLGVELASWGYVVVSVGHDGFNQAVRDPSGASLTADAVTFPEPSGDLKQDALRGWDFLDKHHFPQWIDDARFALDQLQTLDVESGKDAEWPFSGRLALEGVGAFGWSFGGAASIELLVIDARVAAAVDLDGQLFGSASENGSHKPLLILRASGVGLPQSDDPEEAAKIEKAGEELMALVRENESRLVAASTGPRFVGEIEGTNHGTFSDFLYFTPENAGSLDASRAHEILSETLRSFFDTYLRRADGRGFQRERFEELTFEVFEPSP